ncbi:MAG: hypothetical protein LBF40_10715, partial [Deltaproteobacteria bacterium]|nr:hypothetical protein [Deltaproteobacteria bacterium]
MCDTLRKSPSGDPSRDPSKAPSKFPTIFFDFETYYDNEYSLKNLSVEAYVGDPRFEVLLLGLRLKYPDGEMDEDVVEVRDIGELVYFINERYPGSTWVAHNAWFDGYILENHFGVHPRRMLCTAAMANYHGLTWVCGRSLAALSEHLGLGAKGDFLTQSLGKRLEDFDGPGLAAFKDYCREDVNLTAKLYNLFLAWGFGE